MIGRIAIFDVRPQVDCGRWPARAVVGERLTIGATVIREGHGLLGAGVLWRAPGSDKGGGRARRWPMADITRDHWVGEVVADRPGRWSFAVEAWADPIATWRRDIRIKFDAGQNIALDLEEGARLLEDAAREVPTGMRGNVPRRRFAAYVDALRDVTAPAEKRLAVADDAALLALLDEHPLRTLVAVSERLTVWVDRPRALSGAWYEFFPRSEGGTLRTAAQRLPAIAEMGFDVVYLPPIHPIGTTYRKGRNHVTAATSDDPGSPWAIGSPAGGHDAVHPDLGTLDDFDAFVTAASELGLEVALDLALQCSPDHPWTIEHPEWFELRPDGSIHYAENPPKKYQDIYPLSFDTDPDGLYAEVLRIVRHWVAHGVRIFRVDNPHTKPLDFWERLIWAVKADEPDVLFLSEAFTRPPMMYALAKLGFTQSYTYFTWRNTKWELEEYVRELVDTDVADYFRPNFFTNTPDILPAYLQGGGPPAFKVRAVLAALLAPSYGVYSGYELFEAAPLREGSEEYLHSEKFEYRPRDWTQPSLAPYLTLLNRFRHDHPATSWLRNIRLHNASNDAVMAWSKAFDDDVVLVIVNLDPHHVQDATVHLDLAALGLDETDSFTVTDALTGASYAWRGAANYVRLDPAIEPAHVFHVTRASLDE